MSTTLEEMGLFQENLKRTMGIRGPAGMPKAQQSTSVKAMLDERLIKFQQTIRKESLQQYTTDITWMGLEDPIFNINQELIERILFYRGQGIFFMRNGMIEFLPYTLRHIDGTDNVVNQNDVTAIDNYGRFLGVTPMPFNGSDQFGVSTLGEGEADELGVVKEYLTQRLNDLRLRPLYTVGQVVRAMENPDFDPENYAFILRDYTNSVAEWIPPMSGLIKAYEDFEAETLPLIRNIIAKSSRADVYVVKDANTAETAGEELRALDQSGYNNQTTIPVLSPLDIQSISTTPNRELEFAKMYEGIRNIRLGRLGVENMGAYEKSQYTNLADVSLGTNDINLLRHNRLRVRQYIADLLNTMFGTNIEVKLTGQIMPLTMDMAMNDTGVDTIEEKQALNDALVQGGNA